MKNTSYDLIIIGGGAAGIMAAISAKQHHPDFSIAILDRTFALGRKILVCGAGRCNVTNVNLDKSIKDHYYGASESFIQSVFSQFSYQDIIAFFSDLGIEVYTERKTNIGKVFPITDQAKTVTSLLEDELVRLQVDVLLNTEVTVLKKTENHFEIQTNTIDHTTNKTTASSTFKADYVIISAGGKTYPALGANGTGYSLAEGFGHTVIQPVPSALPLVSKNNLAHDLQGVKQELEVTSIIEGEAIKTRCDDVMFTQYGFSGPAILNISRELSIHLNRLNNESAELKINFFPGMKKDDVRELLEKRWTKRPEQSVEKSLFGLFQNKIPAVLLKIANIDKNKLSGSLSEPEKERLVNTLTAYKAEISGTRGWNEAEFTAGGVNTAELQEGTLQSKKVEGLYFCGEVLDVDGDVGGFNLSWAWSSGHVAGKLT